jgi:hypothetical protein
MEKTLPKSGFLAAGYRVKPLLWQCFRHTPQQPWIGDTEGLMTDIPWVSAVTYCLPFWQCCHARNLKLTANLADNLFYG